MFNGREETAPSDVEVRVQEIKNEFDSIYRMALRKNPGSGRTHLDIDPRMDALQTHIQMIDEASTLAEKRYHISQAEQEVKEIKKEVSFWYRLKSYLSSIFSSLPPST